MGNLQDFRNSDAFGKLDCYKFDLMAKVGFELRRLDRRLGTGGFLVLSGRKQKLPAEARSFRAYTGRGCGLNGS